MYVIKTLPLWTPKKKVPAKYNPLLNKILKMEHFYFVKTIKRNEDYVVAANISNCLKDSS